MTRPPRRHTTSEGYMRAAEDLTGCLDLDHGAALREYHQFNTEEARAAFADKWLHLAARRLNETWPMVYELLRLVRDHQLYTKAEALEGKQSFDSFEAYFCGVIGQPFETWAALEHTYQFMQESRRGPSAQPHPARYAGGTRMADDLVVPASCVPGSPSYIHTAVTVAARRVHLIEQDCRPFARDCRELREQHAWETYFMDEPKTWERLCSEVFKVDAGFVESILGGVAILERRGHHGSIPQAKAAGLVKERPLLAQLQHGWTKASAEERDAIAAWLTAQRTEASA